MAKPAKKAIVGSLLDAYGRTYAEEAGIRLERETPAPLFQLLCLSLLLSARISAENAVEATKALIDAGYTTAQTMAEATWQDRVDVLTAHGYKRYDESASRMLGDSAERLLDDYDGDLRELRADADGDVERARTLLQRFKGIGSVGADIFLREVQSAWEEFFPFADDRVLVSAEKLGLGSDTRSLSKLVSRSDFPRLAAALVRVQLDKAHEEVLESAR